MMMTLIMMIFEFTFEGFTHRLYSECLSVSFCITVCVFLLQLNHFQASLFRTSDYFSFKFLSSLFSASRFFFFVFFFYLSALMFAAVLWFSCSSFLSVLVSENLLANQWLLNVSHPRVSPLFMVVKVLCY